MDIKEVDEIMRKAWEPYLASKLKEQNGLLEELALFKHKKKRVKHAYRKTTNAQLDYCLKESNRQILE